MILKKETVKKGVPRSSVGGKQQELFKFKSNKSQGNEAMDLKILIQLKEKYTDVN